MAAIADADLPPPISERFAARAQQAAADRSLFAHAAGGTGASTAASFMHFALLAARCHRTNAWVRVVRSVLASLPDGAAETAGAYVMLDMELSQTPALVTRVLGTFCLGCTEGCLLIAVWLFSGH